MEFSTLQLKIHENVATLILNRPQKHNALSRELLAEIAQALDDLHQENRVGAVILTGSGETFCAGIDLAEIAASKEGDRLQPDWGRDAQQYLDLVLQMLRFPKPIIAAVNGPALASGAGLMLACDLAIGGETASIGFPEPRRGLVAGLVAPLLVFRIGGSHAGYLLMTAESIDAGAAQRIGLLQEIVAGEKLWARANQLATLCTSSAAEALQLTKSMLNETIGEELATLLSAGAAATATARTTEAATEGVKAFLEKRDPKWP